MRSRPRPRGWSRISISLVTGAAGFRLAEHNCAIRAVAERYEARRHDVALEGAEAVVSGRSDLVGKPVAALLLAGRAGYTARRPRCLRGHSPCGALSASAWASIFARRV